MLMFFPRISSTSSLQVILKCYQNLQLKSQNFLQFQIYFQYNFSIFKNVLVIYLKTSCLPTRYPSFPNLFTMFCIYFDVLLKLQNYIIFLSCFHFDSKTKTKNLIIGNIKLHIFWRNFWLLFALVSL